MGVGGEVLKAGAASSPSFLSFFLGSKAKVGKDPSHCTSGECLRKALSYVSKLGASSPSCSSPFLFLIIRDKTQKVTPTLLKDTTHAWDNYHTSCATPFPACWHTMRGPTSSDAFHICFLQPTCSK